MILTIIKQFFIIYSSFYLYNKLLNLEYRHKLTKFLLVPISLVIAYAHYVLVTFIPSFAIAFTILLFYFFVLSLTTVNYKIAFVTTMIAFNLNYLVFSIFVLMVGSIFYGLSLSQDEIGLISIMAISGILTYLAVHIPFLFKRFKKGMRFLYQTFIINSGLLISLITLTYFTFARLREFPGDSIAFLQLLSIFLLGFLLLFWWKNQITKSYIEKLRKAELESLRQELTEKNHEIEKLRENNDALAHIIHRDNKLIPSMEHAVCEFLDNKDSLSVDELAKKGEALAKELTEMAASRTGILYDYQAHGQHIPITGVCSVDALLSYMQKKAFSAGITFQVGISADLTAFTTSVVTPEDLSHLLSDLIENAIHAVKDCPDRNIQLHIHNISGNYTVEISDTGVPFPIEILQGYGIEQQTSHADDGGSGIGLMDIWNLKKKYRASMHIQEFDASSDTWCKKISVIFDSKNHYLIQTYRPEQILMTLKRSDLYVLQL